jgi:hypothetical protein
MRIDHDTADIHDLTDSEAAALREWCAAYLSGKPVTRDDAIVTWQCAFFGSAAEAPCLSVLTFLPRALYALLRRAETERDAARRARDHWHSLRAQENRDRAARW